jgi:hypothetical protein
VGTLGVGGKVEVPSDGQAMRFPSLCKVVNVGKLLEIRGLHTHNSYTLEVAHETSVLDDISW